MDLPLLDWLEKYTFPTESSFSDDRKALSVYTRVVKGTLRQGTTFAAYYSSLHSSASKILADVCMRLGQRALVGKVRLLLQACGPNGQCNMNQNSPSYYIEESAEASLQATQDVVDYIRTQDPDFKLVAPIVTPRFAPSCTQDLLQGLGRMAASQDLHIQTHISENPAEIAWVKSLFPTYEGYMDVYDKNGLIGQKTILAHACWLEDAEVKTAVEKGAGVSHCPISNSAISSGEAPIRDMLNAGVKIGLGTDVSGGYSPSILDVVRHAIMVSRHRCIHHKRTDQQLDLDEVLFLATLGGAQVCDMEARLGNFEPGKLFDALLVDTSSETGSRVEVFEGESFAKILEKWAFHGDDRNLRVVWVNGVPVSGTLYH